MVVNCIREDAVAFVQEDDDEQEEAAYHAQLDASADLDSVSKMGWLALESEEGKHTILLVMLAWGQAPALSELSTLQCGRGESKELTSSDSWILCGLTPRHSPVDKMHL